MNKAFFLDLAERAVATYVQVFLGLLIAAGTTGFDLAAIQAAAVAAIPAALSVLKSALALKFAPEAQSPASFAPSA